ncbi:MAG: PQQ-dependent sugar dehydrogenase [Verrucomicrobiae bacterium]|nr:PQQ-dependent sugar dehydrogenase [Verrucomicrobiae bacterium]
MNPVKSPLLLALLLLWISPLHGQRVVPRLLPEVASSSGLYRLTNAFPSLALDPGIVGFAVPPGRTNELYYYDRPGRIFVITNFQAPTRTMFLNLTDLNRATGDGGLLGLTFHPNYAQNRSFFVFYSPTNTTTRKMYNRLSRFEANPTRPLEALRASEQVLFDLEDESSILHNGGDLHFGPDGYLYVTMGDEGEQDDTLENSQRIDKDLFSSLLRIDVDSRPGSLPPNPHPAVKGGYRIPPDNPYIGATSFNGLPVDPARVRTEFWAVGLRSPHRMCFDPLTGEIYLGDVGGNRVEEINRIERGGNYGWVHFEGNLRSLTHPVLPEAADFKPPVHSYGRTGINPDFEGRAAIGGLVYRGTRYPELNGKYVFGDFISKHIWAIQFQPGGTYSIERLLSAEAGPTTFGLDPATGEILIASTAVNYGISRLVRNPNVVLPSFPPTLSAVGAFANLATRGVRTGIQPYEVAAPFWSDYAIKKRWFFFQDATSKISRSASDVWTFPTGTVWMKHFDLEMVRGQAQSSRPIETRFIVKTSDGVYGLSYRWRSDGSDADLVPESGTNVVFQVSENGVVRNQTWRYPSHSECLSCHNQAAGGVLGFSTQQLNRAVNHNGASVNQLTLLSDLGAFAQPFTSTGGLPRLVPTDDASASIEHRFKSYLDANCAYCHQPNGPGRGSWDGRFRTPTDLSGLLDGPVFDDLGIPGAGLIRLRNTNASVLFRRVSEMGVHHMPPIGTFEAYPAGIQVIREFIESYTPTYRTLWQIGARAVGSEVPWDEFSPQNNINDVPPGRVTRLPGDPQYDAATNPGQDSDFYFAGTYPPGFNEAVSGFSVPNDEPAKAWERAMTLGDRTNRAHFVIGRPQASPGARFRLTFRLMGGGSSKGGVTIPGFAAHDVVVRFRNAELAETILYSSRVTQVVEPVIDFLAADVQALSGPNTIEFVRTGPAEPGVSYWISFDYVKIESFPVTNSAPVLPAFSQMSVDEMVPFNLQLTAFDNEDPPGALRFARVDGPAGLTVSASGQVSWTPTEAQGPSTNLVTVSVTDNGSPPLSATQSFTVVVREVNRPPVFSPPAPLAVDVGSPLAIQLTATDPDLPANTLTFQKTGGIEGLTISPSGLVSWLPGAAQAGTTNLITVSVRDNGTPVQTVTGSFSVIVRPASGGGGPDGGGGGGVRTLWAIGTDAPPGASGSQAFGEFSIPSGRSEPIPGSVTRLPSDPQYSAATNPGADDDFYFKGTYPQGFNGLPSTLLVPNDEPFSAWERALTVGDRTNRFHFLLDSSQVTSSASLELALEFSHGGHSINGTQQPGFGVHDVVIRFRNHAGVASTLFDGRISSPTNIVVQFPAASVQASAGPNSIEMVRTGPIVSGHSYWTEFDYVQLRALAPANRPPVPTPVGTVVVQPGASLSLQLQATDPDLPAQVLTFARSGGPAGLAVTSGGLVTWNPTAAQRPSTNSVSVTVTDNGAPPASASLSFSVVALSASESTGSRTVWQIGTNAPPGSSSSQILGDLGLPSNRADGPPGAVTRRLGDPQFQAGANPGPDDDFYFSGTYPAGFNGLPSTLEVPEDEPSTSWERAHTLGDRTNRFHFHLDPSQASSATPLVLTAEYALGGTAQGGVIIPGFGVHDMVIRFRNGSGLASELFSGRLTNPSNLVVEFTTTSVQATPGPNSVEFVRTGPAASGVSYWIEYDHVRLEAIPGAPAVNQPPVPAAVAPVVLGAGAPLGLQLSATDPDGPAASLTYARVSGPDGLTVSPSGWVAWSPTSAQTPSVNSVTVSVTDNGTPKASATVTFTVQVLAPATPGLRTAWQIGTNAPPGASISEILGDLGLPTFRAEAPPGAVTRRPGDPQFQSGSNPGPDDDFYFKGSYPAGFNGLQATLEVPEDEPSTAWERAHTAGDRTNRFHFHLDGSQISAATGLRLTSEFALGGWSSNGVVLPGFGLHDVVVRFRNGAGVSSVLFNGPLSTATNVVAEFTAASVQATPGPNTVELVRTGPFSPGISYWLEYDYVLLEVVPPANRPPVIASVGTVTLEGGGALSLQLSATDPDLPAQSLAFARVAGPAGLTVSSGGLVTWSPVASQIPSTNQVTVSVTDNGVPPASSSVTFTVVVRASQSVASGLVRTVWQIGTNAPVDADVFEILGDLGMPSFRAEAPPGAVTRRPGDPQYEPGSNPGPDDDFYFAGTYPVGFNGLLSILQVPQDEPSTAWERAHTLGDRTNRFHFLLDASQAASGNQFRLTAEYALGGFAVDGVTQSAFGDHDVVIQFRNGLGATVPLFDSRLTTGSNVVVEFSAGAVQAIPGPNSVEFVRTGPALSGRSYWLEYDHVRLEHLVSGASGFGVSRSLRPTVAALPPFSNTRAAITNVEGVDYLTILFERPVPPPSGARYVVEGSNDLLDWSEQGVLPIERIFSGSGYETVAVRDAVPVAAQEQRYLRLRVVLDRE